MTPDLYDRANDIFLQACDLPDQECAAFLQRACGNDAQLRAQVQAMLNIDSQSCDAVEFAAAGGVGDMLAKTASEADSCVAEMPERLGEYTLIRKIGEGGMGTVYEATQEHPRRTVALKVIRPGLTSGQLLDRFRREADFLGRLQHSGIAHIYDAGVGELQLPNSAAIEQPYFAMEFINGPTIDEYAKNQKLAERQKLDLLIKVCDAVQHAHERGVIHRDLKPANILVQSDGQPKILDFGVSRATDADVQAVTMQTDVGQLVGTIAYMSPEQALGDPTKIDPRSDVYALGVIGFELLSGRLPIPVRGHAIPEAARLIREVDPSRLSSIHTRYRGDIDTMIQKALEKEADRRYQSAGALSADLQRFLLNEPISAHPPSRIYQVAKFARRNRGLVGGVIGMILFLTAGTITSSIFAWQAAARRDEAQQEARRVAALNQFLVNDVFKSASPIAGATHDMYVKDMLANATNALETSFAQDADIEFLIRNTLGNIFLTLNEFDLAEVHLRRAMTLAEELWPIDTREAIRNKHELARALWRNSRLDESRELLNEILAIQKSSRAFSEADIASTLKDLGHVAYNRGDYADAEELFRESNQRQGAKNSDPMLEADNLVAIANAQLGLNKLDESIENYRAALAIETEHLGADHLETTLTQHNLGGALSTRGDHEEANVLLNKALATRRRILGNENVDVADTLFQLGKLALRKRELDDAMTFGKEALTIQQKLLRENHEDLAETHDLLGTASRLQSNFAAAERHARESHRIYEATQPESRAAAITLSSVGVALLKQEKYEEAIDVHRQVLEKFKAVFGADHAIVYQCQASLADCLARTGHADEAESLLIESIKQLESQDHPKAAWAREILATVQTTSRDDP